MSYWFVFLLWLGTATLSALAQAPAKEIRQQQQIWLMYQVQPRFSERWGGILEIHYRRSGHFINHPGTQINRIGVSYFPHQNIRLSANYAYVTLRTPFNEGPARPEHRSWLEASLNLPFSRFTLNQRFRAEQRFVHRSDGRQLTDGYRFNHRLRYQLGISWPLRRPGTRWFSPNLVVNEEILFNAGREIIHNHFDQNQFFVGLSCPLGRGVTFQTGYLSLFQQLSTGNRYIHSHILRFTVFHLIDMRK